MSSMAGIGGQSSVCAYSASKAAVAGWQVEFVVRQQGLLRLDLPEPHRGQHRLAAEVHECRRLEQPHAAPADVDLRRFAEQLGVDLETLAGFLRERVDKTEPGVVPGPCVFRRSEEHTSELQSLMRITYAVFCLKKKKQ